VSALDGVQELLGTKSQLHVYLVAGLTELVETRLSDFFGY
jgi:hypothetical protein